MKKQKGFTLVELLVSIAIIGVMATIVIVALSGVRAKGYDAKRKAEISSFGRLITASCYLPDAGAGTYDIQDLISEFVSKNPQYATYVSHVPKDPKASSGDSLYMYIVNTSGKCALYANLENDNEPTTLTNISAPTPGGGTGVFQAPTQGWNGSTKYFQVSN